MLTPGHATDPKNYKDMIQQLSEEKRWCMILTNKINATTIAQNKHTLMKFLAIINLYITQKEKLIKLLQLQESQACD